VFLIFILLFIEVRTLEHNSVDVDVVYVINLDRSPKRLKKMKDQLDKFGIRFKRLRASDGYNIRIVNKSRWQIEDNKQFHKNCDKNCVYLAQDSDVSVGYIPNRRGKSLCCGELGCALSHIRIWYDIVKCGYKCAVIFEDDVLFEDNFPQILKETLQNAPLDMDVLFLDVGVGHWEYATPYFVSPGVLLQSFERLRPDNMYVVRLRNKNYAFGTHAYAVTKAGAAKLIQNSKALRWPIDNHIILLSNISKYVAKKKMLYVSEEMSEIHMMGRNKSIIPNEIIDDGNKP
jgi:GR25 family glycosyltransferase involved in LPS biosynthesis